MLLATREVRHWPAIRIRRLSLSVCGMTWRIRIRLSFLTQLVNRLTHPLLGILDTGIVTLAECWHRLGGMTIDSSTALVG
jgi:hypothetical protein